MRHVFIIIAVFAAGLSVANEQSCPAFEIVNHSGTWNEKDSATLDRSVEPCDKRYGPRGNPCLKLFIKKDEGVYNAICGPKE